MRKKARLTEFHHEERDNIDLNLDDQTSYDQVRKIAEEAGIDTTEWDLNEDELREKRQKERKKTGVNAEESKLYQEIKEVLNKESNSMTEIQLTDDEFEWENPVPFDDYEVPKFNSKVFSPTIKTMVDSVSKFTQTPNDLPAMIAIGVLSTILSKKFVVEPVKGWKEPLNTFTTILMESSNRKSAAYKAMTEPIYLYENELIEEMAPKVKKD